MRAQIEAMVKFDNSTTTNSALTTQSVTLPDGTVLSSATVTDVTYLDSLGNPVLHMNLMGNPFGIGGAPKSDITGFWLEDINGNIIIQFSGFAPVDPDVFFASFIDPPANADPYSGLVDLTDGGSNAFGGIANDVFDMGTGDNSVTGGLGDDRLVKLGNGTIIFDGGAGIDTMSFQPRSNILNPNSITRQLIVDLSTHTGVNPYGNGTLQLTNVENIIGTGSADRITGDDYANVIGDGLGDRGADYIIARGGNDVVKIGDLGLARAFGGNGFDTLMFLDNVDLTDVSFTSRYVGFEKYELLHFFILNGTGFTFTGDAGNNWFMADDAIDTLQGGGGDDTLDGGLAYTSVFGPGADIAVYSGTRAQYTITVQGGTVTVTDNRAGSPDGSDTVVNVETLRFSNRDVSVATLAPNIGNGQFGTSGDDGVGANSAKDDSAYGLDGNDTLFGGGGSNLLVGGRGDDTYQLSDGATDTIVELAGGGMDTIIIPTFWSLPGFSLAGYANVENLLNDHFIAMTLTGNGLGNVITSWNGSDTLSGGAGNDTLIGAFGQDVLKGGSGDDVLIGGVALINNQGRDLMTGGIGNDVFKFNAINESGVTAGDRDIITDFNANGVDRIDLSAIDAIAGGGDNAFVFIGAGPFTGNSQVRAVVSGGTTLVYVNMPGTLGPDMAIQLTGAMVLDAADFIL